MRVQLNKVFPLDSSVDEGWEILRNIEAVAACMPGAEITNKISETEYEGKVKVKIGPVTVAFDGEITVAKIDADNRQIQLIAKGQDSKGTSSAEMDLTANIRSNGASPAELVGDAAVTVNGKLANFGGRMMTQVSDQILNQFAANFSETLSASSQGINGATAVPLKNKDIRATSILWNLITGFFKRLFRISSS